MRELDEQNTSQAPAYDIKLKIKGLCCANCGRELEEELNAIEGVTATVDFINSQIKLCAQNKGAYDAAIYAVTHFEDVRLDEGERQKNIWRAHLREIIGIGVGALLLALALVFQYVLAPKASDHVFLIIGYCIYLLAYLAVGYPVLWQTVKNLLKGKIFDENFLMTLASLGAIALGFVGGDGFFEGVAVMLLYQIGELFQAVAVGASRRSISKLMDLKTNVATLFQDGVAVIVNPESLNVGDIILLKAGEKVPVDAVIVKGETSLDYKSLNGEPMPRDVGEGDEILSGSVVVAGVVQARVLRTYQNSAVAKILELVENSTATKTKSEKFITKFAKYYTPIVCLLAVIVAGVIPTITSAFIGQYTWAEYQNWLYRALNFLVISCPCALVISVPLSYFCGIGKCADFGILVKGSAHLDAIASVTLAAFDKTGTLTQGAFTVTQASSEYALALAAAAERYSSHPIAAAFADIEGVEGVDGATELAGRGMKCDYQGQTLLCGNAKLLAEQGVSFPEQRGNATYVYVALNGAYMGVIAIDDAPKQGAKRALANLKAAGVTQCVMLTGDTDERAQAVAEELALDGVYAKLLPDEKLAVAQKLQRQERLLYVGDGINDAPVMVAAHCAVSMGKVGSDAAVEASDIVLLTDDLSLLAKAKNIAKVTKRIVWQNIIGSLLIKLAVMVLSVCLPAFPLIIGILADVGVMVLAVLNALRIKWIKA